MTTILGLETSCDETATAVVAEGGDILSNIVASQVEIHARYGGVFPEIASRQHIRDILPVIEEALGQAKMGLGQLDGLAVTIGPGLAGSLVVGVNAAKGLALALNLPLIGINHLEAHIYTIWTQGAEIEFPLLCLIASGGHTNLVLMSGHCQYEPLGQALDDAAGEAFDKVARLLGLGYPGGPAIQEAAKEGDSEAFDLPRAWLPGTYNFSFSGLKTAVLYLVRRLEGEGKELPLADLAASFQAALVDVLVEKTRLAAQEYGVKPVLLAGGVAANTLLRQEMRERVEVPVLYPPPKLCTDNALGVASAGWFRFQRSERSGLDLDVVPSLRLT